MKIAIVYDWIDKWGGVERLLLNLHELYPDADFYTSYYDPQKATWAVHLKIKTSFIQKLPSFVKNSRVLSLPFYPIAFETFDFSEYDLVISVTSSFAKGVITKPNTKHICYLLTPPRYLWGQQDNYVENQAMTMGSVALGSSLRKWDFVAAQRPDKMIAISQHVADRAKKYYQRECEVVFPPFDLDYWNKVKKSIKEEDLFSYKKPYHLIVSRLEQYKKIDVVLDAFKQLPESTLVIVGDGTQKERLKRKASQNVIFLGSISDKRLADVYMRAASMLMPQEEDFGYVSLESQFFGTPVISYRYSGAAETIIENKTGLYFEKQTQESIIAIIKESDQKLKEMKEYLKAKGNEHLSRFDNRHFIEKFSNIV